MMKILLVTKAEPQIKGFNDTLPHLSISNNKNIYFYELDTIWNRQIIVN